MGDRAAIMTAYPRAKGRVLDRYDQDSVCGTWELLADALYQGGAAALKAEGWPRPGEVKCEWAQAIAPHMDADKNLSKSFQVFCDGLRKIAELAL